MREGFEKRFENGDIVYWCHHDGNAVYSVHWGMVDEQFLDAVIIDYLVHKENRLINGIPYDEFIPDKRYHKLPKGWTVDTKLFELSYARYPFDDEKLDLHNPEDIRKAYDNGWLVKDNTIDHSRPEAEIEREGYRIVKKYQQWENHFTHRSVRPDKVYFTYDEAKKEVDDNVAEFKRQASLSDYEWSVEQIDKTLNYWQYLSGETDRKKEKYRDWLLSMKDVEDIEVRIFNGEI